MLQIKQEDNNICFKFITYVLHIILDQSKVEYAKILEENKARIPCSSNSTHVRGIQQEQASRYQLSLIVS